MRIHLAGLTHLHEGSCVPQSDKPNSMAGTGVAYDCPMYHLNFHVLLKCAFHYYVNCLNTGFGYDNSHNFHEKYNFTETHNHDLNSQFVDYCYHGNHSDHDNQTDVFD